MKTSTIVRILTWSWKFRPPVCYNFTKGDIALIKLLVVDDEQATRKGLVKHINWLKLGISRVTEARDGLEGLEMARGFLPDIVITDIYMPGMNGIEMAGNIREQFPYCKIIFLSGYSDKEYLKAAIHLNAIRYIEKPINLDEVIEAVKKAVALVLEETEKILAEKKIRAALSQNLQIIRRNLIASLASRKADYGEFADSFELAGAGFKSDDTFTAVMLQLSLLSGQTSEETQETISKVLGIADECLRDVRHVCAPAENGRIDVILASETTVPRSRVQTFLDEMKTVAKKPDVLCDGLFCAVGLPASGISQIWQSYETAQAALQKLFYLGYGSIVFYEKKVEDAYNINESLPGRFGDLLQNQEKEKSVQFITNLCQEFALHPDTAPEKLKSLFVKMAYQLLQEAEKRGVHISDSGTGMESDLWSRILTFKTLAEVREYLICNTECFYNRVSNMQSTGKAVHKVMEYIQKNFASGSLSNTSLSEYVYLTPTYLSCLFKKETGKTIGDYLIEIRMEKSKELLKKHHNKLFEIARAVGYSDPNYFAKVFKKQVGMTPSEYRGKYKS
jgi:two-component system, response regulator YesN